MFLPVMYVLMAVFLLFGGLDVYPWMHWTEADAPPHKAIYLTQGFFTLRLLLGLGILMVLSLYMIKVSVRADMGMAKEVLEKAGKKAPASWERWIAGWQGSEVESAEAQRKQLTIAPVVCISYALIYSMVAVDVSMSLSPYWYANMFPAWVFMSSIWSGLVYIALFSLLCRDWLGVKELLPSNVYHDLGKLTFAFCMFWGYTTFAQYLPIYYGNMTEEIGFVLLRTAAEPWAVLGQVVFVTCFVAPWTILLSRGIKKMPRAYIGVACLIAVGIWLERFLVNMPSIHMENFIPLGIPEIGMTVGILGLLILVVTTFLSKVPAAVISDPFIQVDPDHVHVVPSSSAHAH